MTEDYRNEIRWLVSEKYKGQVTDEAKKDIARITAGEPVDYVIGWTDFLGCRIDLSQRPHIPRPETEYWTEKAIEDMYQYSGSSVRVLDIFAGSGCIGIAVLHHVPQATIDFAEADSSLMPQIKRNLERNRNTEERSRIIQSDIFSGVQDRYDYILANPPYIPLHNKEEVDGSVLKWEPHRSLFGGEDGLAYIRRFLHEAPAYLNKKGKLYMEFDVTQAYAIEQMVRERGYGNYALHKDQYGRLRYLVARM